MSDWQGYGPNWERIADQVRERDDYTCQRCLNESGEFPLQAHHLHKRSEGGSDNPSNLITLCRPCHGVQHPDNEVFDDSRPHATLFPRPGCHGQVAAMRTPPHQTCSRCRQQASWTNLVSYQPNGPQGDYFTVCQACGGVMCAALDVDASAFWAPYSLDTDSLTDQMADATVRPSFWTQLFGPSPANVRRDPVTTKEKLIDNTPLRFLKDWRVWGLLILLYLMLPLIPGVTVP